LHGSLAAHPTAHRSGLRIAGPFHLGW
jgi:hypothetical protein